MEVKLHLLRIGQDRCRSILKTLNQEKISRATFEGSAITQNQFFSPDGKDLALIHRVGKDYRLALLDIASRDLTVMTQNKSDESPYFHQMVV